MRPIKNIVNAPFRLRHYRAAFNMPFVYVNAWDAFGRYVSGIGTYPHDISLRTPRGVVTATMFCRDDILTVNKSFCRGDYKLDSTPEIIVDIGANIGISALYFVSRGAGSRCYAFEPNPVNVAKMNKNVRDFRQQIVIRECAVAPISGRVMFGVEDSGRYGGIGVMTDKRIEVEAVGINEILSEVMHECGKIDVLKIDVEGLEGVLLDSIEPQIFSKIGVILVEAPSYSGNKCKIGCFRRRGPILVFEPSGLRGREGFGV